MDKKIKIDGRIIYTDNATLETIKRSEHAPATASSNPNQVSVRISLMIEAQLLQDLKRLSEKRNTPYQTLMKQFIREKMAETQIAHFYPEPTDYVLEFAEQRKPLIKYKNRA
jgi:hypothetical protein